MIGPGHSTQYQCGICFKSFPGRYKLKRHSVVHTKERPYACELCDRRFPHSEYLDAHMKNKHNKQNIPY